MEPLSMALMMGGGMLTNNLLKGVGGQQAGAIQAGGAQNAALWQALAAGQAQNNYANYYGEAKAALNPYVTAGQKSMDLLQSYLTGTNAKTANIGGGGDTLMTTFQPTMAQLESTPGYQWARQQGLGAMTNSMAAKGLGTSGNLVQGIGETATGLASQTFNDQLRNYMNQNLQAYNMLFQPAQMGAQAAGTLGQLAVGTGGNIGNAILGAGTAMGQGTMGAANAYAGGTNALYGGIGAGIQGAATAPLMTQYYGNANPNAPKQLPGAAGPQGLFDWTRNAFIQPATSGAGPNPFGIY